MNHLQYQIYYKNSAKTKQVHNNYNSVKLYRQMHKNYPKVQTLLGL